MAEHNIVPRGAIHGNQKKKSGAGLTNLDPLQDDAENDSLRPGPHFTMEMITEANALLKKANKYNYMQYLQRLVPDLIQFLAEGKANRSNETDLPWIAKAELIFRQFSHLAPVESLKEQYLEHLYQLIFKIEEIKNGLETELYDFGPGKTYEVMDLHGEMRELIIPSLDEYGARSKYTLNISSYSEISKSLKEESGENSSLEKLVPYKLEVAAEYNHSKWQACDSLDGVWSHWADMWTYGKPYNSLGSWKYVIPSDNFEHTYTAFGWRPWTTMPPDECQRIRQSESETSSSWKSGSTKLQTLIQKHANRLKSVDQVVCFALGPISNQHPTSFVQHLAAHTIHDAIRQLNSPDDTAPPIEILAQDPAYCERCRVVLKDELNITTTTSLDGFLRLTKDTFVVCIAPSAPVLQIVADLLRVVGGPAAILCDTINEDYPPASSSLGYDGIADEPTSNLIKYVQSCDNEYFGDAREVLGMDWEEFTKAYPLGPAQLGRKLDEEKQVWTKEDRKGWERCKELWKLAGKVNFRDVTLYIRK